MCGEDGQEYLNSCLATCEGVVPECDGQCPCSIEPICKCTLELFPVCGQDGQEYDNACLAGCDGVVPECEGQCPCKQNGEWLGSADQ